MMTPTNEQYKMARFLNLDPRDPSDWPMVIIDRLIQTEQQGGRVALHYALQKLTMNWEAVINECRRRTQSPAE